VAFRAIHTELRIIFILDSFCKGLFGLAGESTANSFKQNNSAHGWTGSDEGGKSASPEKPSLKYGGRETPFNKVGC